MLKTGMGTLELYILQTGKVFSKPEIFARLQINEKVLTPALMETCVTSFSESKDLKLTRALDTKLKRRESATFTGSCIKFSTWLCSTASD